MQNKIQQLFKEYLDLKLYIQEENKELEEKKKKAAEKALKLESIEEIASMYFEDIGQINLLLLDLNNLKTQLYHYYHAFENMIEIPEEIKNELEGFSIKYIFSVKNGVKEIADKELYNSYKQQHYAYMTQVEEYSKNKGSY